MHTQVAAGDYSYVQHLRAIPTPNTAACQRVANGQPEADEESSSSEEEEEEEGGSEAMDAEVGGGQRGGEVLPGTCVWEPVPPGFTGAWAYAQCACWLAMPPGIACYRPPPRPC